MAITRYLYTTVQYAFIITVLLPRYSLQSGTCYYPDGSIASRYEPCTDDENSVCCTNSSMCLSNGLCQNTCTSTETSGMCQSAYTGTFYRGACTDPTWQSDSCP